MHPSRELLRKYVDSQIADKDEAAAVDEHLIECEICREFRDCTLIESLTAETADEVTAARIGEAAQQVYNQTVRGRVIRLLAPSQDESPVRTVLAADGEEKSHGRIENIATLYSDSPELVLRLMQDTEERKSYLQLIGADKSFTSHVLVQAEELGLDFLTDETGRAEICGPSAAELVEARWQIKMPEAVFSLTPQQYDPDQTEYADLFVLETDHGDKVEVRFVGKTEGKKISVKVVELDGQKEFGSLRVHVTAKSNQESATASPGGEVTFDLVDETGTIDIRLFQQ